MSNKRGKVKAMLLNFNELASLGRQAMLTGVGCLCISMTAAEDVKAHPHVFANANLEIVRNDEGMATEIRHVWRFDEIFSSSVLLDFDADGDGKLDVSELETVANTVKGNISEFNFYTEVRQGTVVANFYEPEPFLVDYADGQLTMIFALELEKPEKMGATGFRVAVSDPTYYVAIELDDTNSVTVSGNASGCSSTIERPDFDALWAKDAERMARVLAAAPDEEVEASDDFLTWVNFKCE